MSISKETAIKILDPETSLEALAELEYNAGFNASSALKDAVAEARVLGAAALREVMQTGSEGNNLRRVTTVDLVQELTSREGVYTTMVALEEIKHFDVDGPAVVLTVID